MKSTIRIINLSILILIILLTNSCREDVVEVGITKEKITGYVQKGPFINGTSIIMYELNSSLGQTGNTFSTQIIDNKGSFEISNIELSSQYVEFTATGYYYNEFTGEISVSPLTLYALSDITDLTSVNVNLLTHLEKARVEYLVDQGYDFSVAKDSAQSEVLSVFGMNKGSMDQSEKLDISVNNDENAILLAISIILQGDRSVGNLTELLANINTDITQDGVLNNTDIISELRSTTLTLDLMGIRTNLEKRYSDLGVSATIPEFEKYIGEYLLFTGYQPTATTLGVTNRSATGATISGLVNAGDISTNVVFEYGATSSYGASIQAIQNPVTGNTDKGMSADLSELLPKTTYHYRVVATNALGTVYGDDMTFETLDITSTSEASDITLTRATLNGTLDANITYTTVLFEFGTSINYDSSKVAVQESISIDPLMFRVSVKIYKLLEGTTYHYRLVAESSDGTTYCDDMTFTTPISVSDIDGNSYNTVIIGTQTWMAENLRTTKYSDGTEIPNVTDAAEWTQMTSPAYCWYENNEAEYKNRGALYNWYVVAESNPKNVCPSGWHIPSDEEWTTLEIYLQNNGYNYDGTVDSDNDRNTNNKVAKSLATVSGWDYSSAEGAAGNTDYPEYRNKSGFTAFPSGTRYPWDPNASFNSVNSIDNWWTSTPEGAKGLTRTIQTDFIDVGRGPGIASTGYPTRCVKDN